MFAAAKTSRMPPPKDDRPRRNRADRKKWDDDVMPPPNDGPRAEQDKRKVKPPTMPPPPTPPPGAPVDNNRKNRDKGGNKKADDLVSMPPPPRTGPPRGNAVDENGIPTKYEAVRAGPYKDRKKRGKKKNGRSPRDQDAQTPRNRDVEDEYEDTPRGFDKRDNHPIIEQTDQLYSEDDIEISPERPRKKDKEQAQRYGKDVERKYDGKLENDDRRYESPNDNFDDDRAPPIRKKQKDGAKGGQKRDRRPVKDPSQNKGIKRDPQKRTRANADTQYSSAEEVDQEYVKKPERRERQMDMEEFNKKATKPKRTPQLMDESLQSRNEDMPKPKVDMQEVKINEPVRPVEAKVKPSTDAKYDKYRKMLAVGVPAGAVMLTMKKDKVTPPPGFFDEDAGATERANDTVNKAPERKPIPKPVEAETSGGTRPLPAPPIDQSKPKIDEGRNRADRPLPVPPARQKPRRDEEPLGGNAIRGKANPKRR